jgi:U3 small nucleolar RNA-associated protein 19
MPTKDSDIDSFWLEGFGSKLPRKTKTKQNSANSDSESEAEEEDDWRTFFDDPQPSTTASAQQQTKKKRIHKMSVAEQIRSVASHRAVFTRCWIMLLPLLSSSAFVAANNEKGKSGKNDSKKRKSEKQASKAIAVPDATSLTTRALTVLHRGVMPHLTRAVLVMDWVAGCVDQGEELSKDMLLMI